MYIHAERYKNEKTDSLSLTRIEHTHTQHFTDRVIKKYFRSTYHLSLSLVTRRAKIYIHSTTQYHLRIYTDIGKEMMRMKWSYRSLDVVETSKSMKIDTHKLSQNNTTYILKFTK